MSLLLEGLDFPERAMERLYERAKAEQWQIDRDINWQAFKLGELGPRIQTAMARLYSQLQYGEYIGLTQIARAVDLAPHVWTKLFGATQVMDEARHVEFFSRVLAEFPDKPPVDDRLVTFGESLRSAQTPLELMLGTQVLLEGFAHCLFAEGARLGRKAAARAVKLPDSGGALAFLDALERYVGKDETRHVAFGVLYLRHELTDVPMATRDHLARRAAEWSAMLDSFVESLAGDFANLGISGDALLQQIRRERATHLHTIGLI